jgi:hypothetical protein
MRRPPRAQSCLGFVRGAPAVCGRRARSISPLSLPCERLPRCACCRVRGPRRVRGAALRPGGLLLLCSACTRTESRSSRAALTTPRFLVGKNASAKENFGERRRRPPPGTAGERSEGSDERSLVRPVRRAHGSAAAKPTAGRPGLPSAVAALARRRPSHPATSAALLRPVAPRRARAAAPHHQWPAPATILSTGTNSKRGSPRKTRPSSWMKCGAPGRRTTSRRGDGRPRTTRPKQDISKNSSARSYFI